jgi:hypothetical protein
VLIPGQNREDRPPVNTAGPRPPPIPGGRGSPVRSESKEESLAAAPPETGPAPSETTGEPEPGQRALASFWVALAGAVALLGMLAGGIVLVASKGASDTRKEPLVARGDAPGAERDPPKPREESPPDNKPPPVPEEPERKAPETKPEPPKPPAPGPKSPEPAPKLPTPPAPAHEIAGWIMRCCGTCRAVGRSVVWRGTPEEPEGSFSLRMEGAPFRLAWMALSGCGGSPIDACECYPSNGHDLHGRGAAGRMIAPPGLGEP